MVVVKKGTGWGSHKGEHEDLLRTYKVPGLILILQFLNFLQVYQLPPNHTSFHFKLYFLSRVLNLAFFHFCSTHPIGPEHNMAYCTYAWATEHSQRKLHHCADRISSQFHAIQF